MYWITKHSCNKLAFQFEVKASLYFVRLPRVDSSHEKLVANYVPFCALTVKTYFEIRSDLSHDVILIWSLNLT